MNHKDLDAWKLSIEFVTEIYKITQKFPKEEFYGLTNQIRRSSVSIPSNIAEGCAKQYDKETIHFLYISVGSIAELETQLIIAEKLHYIETSEDFIKSLVSIRSLILGLIKYLKNKTTSPLTLHSSP